MMRTALVALAAMASVANADIYLHAPPGSNCRNRERNDNRNNGNRLFDSQNNNKGGYAWRGSPTMQGSLDHELIPDPLVYYTGSRLRLEWTNQHGCGPNPNIYCQLIIQYSCHNPDEDVESTSTEWLQGLRDGYPMSPTIEESDATYPGYRRRRFLAQEIPGTNTAQNQQGTTRIPDNAFPDSAADRENFYYLGGLGGMEFGMHEGYHWYELCRNTQRNKGLYISDQNLNKNDCRSTRQNPNGNNRRGLECPEERDYYPYWRPTPWRDIAVMVSNTSWCPYYVDNSQNVVDSFYCACDSDCQNAAENDLIPINDTACVAAGGTWETRPALGGGAPDCMYHQFNRDNHLGNSAPVDEDGNILAEKWHPNTAFYNWIVPSEAADKHCVLRLRYNMTTQDVEWMRFADKVEEHRSVVDNSFSCRNMRAQRNDDDVIRIAQGLPTEEDIAGLMPQCTGVLNETHKPIFERPYVNLFPDNVGTDKSRQLAIAINTDQVGRTFQDRTHVFKVEPRPSGKAGGRIFNLGVRGRRGNIVQAYPSVEYDFTPDHLEVAASDWVHIQIHGSDFNEAKNANNGEGWRYSDRHNMVEVAKAGENIPLPMSQRRMFTEITDAEFFALLGQTGCTDYYYNGNDNTRTDVQNKVDNCAQLNKAPNRFPQDPVEGLIKFREGHYYYVSTRENNFSNRSHKAQLIVGQGQSNALSSEEKAAVAVGVIATVGVAVAGLLLFAKKKPRSAVAGCFRSTADFVTCQNSGAAASTASKAPTMDYTRH